MDTFFAGIGAAVIFGALAAGIVVIVAHWTTTEYQKTQNGGPDLSWYVIALLVGLLTAVAAFTYTLASA